MRMIAKACERRLPIAKLVWPELENSILSIIIEGMHMLGWWVVHAAHTRIKEIHNTRQEKLGERMCARQREYKVIIENSFCHASILHRIYIPVVCTRSHTSQYVS